MWGYIAELFIDSQQNNYFLAENGSNKYSVKFVPYSFGYFLVDFLNIDFNKVTKDINNSEVNQWNLESILLNIFQKHCHTLVITNFLLKQLHISTNSKFENLFNFLSLMEDSFYNLQREIKEFLHNNTFEKDGFVESVFLYGHNQKINVTFRYDEIDGVFSTYHIQDLYSLIAFELVNVKNSNTFIKTCENCGNYFIPSKRSDEIYCDRTYKNNKTCKQIGCVIKANNNPFKKNFTAARKVQYARIKYNNHIANYREKHYEPWLEAAQNARDTYEKLNDLEGFVKWIENNKDAF